MNETRSKVRNPYFFALILLGIFILGGAVGGVLHTVSAFSLIVQVAASDFVLAVIGMLLLYRLNWWQKAGYASLIQARDLPLLILPFIVALLSLSDGIAVTSPLLVVGFALFALLVGFTEETFFRGLMLTGLLPTGSSGQSSCRHFFLQPRTYLISLPDSGTRLLQWRIRLQPSGSV